MTIEETVKEYQCSGCVNGHDLSCYKKDAGGTIGRACSVHYPGTFIIGVGKILLGMPKGFNHLGAFDWKNVGFGIFSTYDEFIAEYHHILDQPKYSVPVWRYRNEAGHTFLRIYSPRVNAPAIVVVLEDCIDKFTCIEITKQDMEYMD